MSFASGSAIKPHEARARDKNTGLHGNTGAPRGMSRSNLLQSIDHPDGVWPENQVTVLPWKESGRSRE